jgi:hypothetical protein
MRDDKEKAYCRLPLVVFQDRNELVRQAKYELEHMMLMLEEFNVNQFESKTVFVNRL